MSAERLWLEGHTTIDGRCINIGSVEFDQYARYPHTHGDGEVVGFITDIQRHDNGWVTGEPVLVPDFHWPKDSAISVALSPVQRANPNPAPRIPNPESRVPSPESR